MSTSDVVFAGPVPALYERLLVPILFAPYAADLAERAARLAPRRILETAAGTGAVTRLLAATLPSQVRILATDLNPAMLEAAKATIDDPRIDWRVADALSLPLEAGSVDLVLCQFGVMFFPDRRQGLREAHRVLAPGGRLLLNSWGRLEDNDFAAAVHEALAECFPRDPPLFLARTPHGYASFEQMRADVEAAGFVDVTATLVRRTGVAGSPAELARAFCQGTPLRGEIEARAPEGLEEVTKDVERALARRFGEGRQQGALAAIVASAATGSGDTA